MTRNYKILYLFQFYLLYFVVIFEHSTFTLSILRSDMKKENNLLSPFSI